MVKNSTKPTAELESTVRPNVDMKRITPYGNPVQKNGGSNMLCPRCNSSMLKTVDSRPSKESTRRRRVCLKCGERFSTYEISAERFKELNHKEALLSDLLTFSHKTEEKLKEVKA